ncbi:MAG: carbamoyltransferase HypF [Rhodocyclaceae bacterium]|nr:carbamoyltransferase HypF [Rhodocyclaceae bacterium]
MPESRVESRQESRTDPARRIRVRGIVQGVGFRPFVWRLARESGLSGWVRNDSGGVDIAVEGAAEQLDRFQVALAREAPPLARVDAVEARDVPAEGFSGFSILESGAGQAATAIGPDAGTCPDCLAELFDAEGRRWRHAFITCTHCGPRYTVTRHLPYDRPQTSLAPFPLCAECAAEYADPADRRFHAETTCCPACGPRLELLDAAGRPLPGDAVAAALDLLRRGGIVAVKGLGGFHLLCDAEDGAAVSRLRERKAREEKPFAVLFANLASVAPVCELGPEEGGLLGSSERPIVLLRKKPGEDPAGVAPGLAWLGAMLPATPLQYLLFHEAAGRPRGTDWLKEAQPLALVCTSANPGGEPLVTDNAEALSRLAGIADACLLHDRDIVVRCDDSVVRVVGSGEWGVESQESSPRAPGAQNPTPHSLLPTSHFQFVRRGRGYTPLAIRLSRSGPAVLALGGWFKNTVCVTRGDEAFVSQHVGDLDNAATCRFLEETVDHLLSILEVEPEMVAHDLHPDFHSSRYAAAFAARRHLPAVAVQHHHAHVASVLAEHGHTGPALGLALDGVGLGSDGGAWGGELLRLDGGQCLRLGHLAALALPGGDKAAREPWRMAAAALHALGRGGEISGRFPGQPGAAMVAQMLERKLRSPETSSMGRLFDAAAGLLGVAQLASFEGQAAMRLEGLADSWIVREGWPSPLTGGWRIAGGSLDMSPLLAFLADCEDAGFGAALFHATVAAALVDWVGEAAAREHIATVACGGGCFLNALLSRRLVGTLAARGLEVLMAARLPPNDGGLSLGQAWVALRTLEN